jgi:hypothetical protein
MPCDEGLSSVNLRPSASLPDECVEICVGESKSGRSRRSETTKKKKANRKRLVFNDFSSRGRIRTSDLRVMRSTVEKGKSVVI